MVLNDLKACGYAAFPLLALFGCALDTSDVDSSEGVASASEALLVNPTTYTWSQGQSPKVMTTIDTSICFLSRVGGNFAGWGEKVFISTAAGSPGSPGVWTLGGQSGQTGIHAHARCVGDLMTNQILYPEKIWSQGQAATVLAPATGHACFLTRMEGRFRSTTETLRIRQLNGNWVLDGTSSEADVVGGARCLKVNGNSEDEVSWSSGQSLQNMGLSNKFRRTCHLTRVSGRFTHVGSYVTLHTAGEVDNPGWWLGGASNPAQARGRCVMQ